MTRQTWSGRFEGSRRNSRPEGRRGDAFSERSWQSADRDARDRGRQVGARDRHGRLGRGRRGRRVGLRQLDALAGSALDPEGAGACRRRLARARAALTGRGAGKTGRRRTRTGALRLRARLPSFTKVGTQFHSRSPPNVTKAATPSGRPDLRPLSVESRGPGIHDVGGCPAIGGSGSGRRECRSRYDATATAWRNGCHGFVEPSPSSRTPTAGWRRRADLNCLPMVCHAVERATDRQREDTRSMLL